MPIYRCNQCGLVAEGALLPVGAQTPCSRCGAPSTVFGTVYYVEKLVERYFAATRELAALRASENAEPPPDQSEDQAGQESTAPYLGGDLHNTSALATPEQHAPLQAWFTARQIEARFDHSLIDTSGFFDDAARLIGDGYALFGQLMERIRLAY